MRLCLLRGFITVVKLAFSLEDSNMKYQAAQGLPHGLPCSFERFLWEWNCWIVTTTNTPFHNRWPSGYDENIVGIVIADRHAFCHVYITNKPEGHGRCLFLPCTSEQY